MARYRVLHPLKEDRKYEPGEVIELSEKRARALGDLVEPIPEEKAPKKAAADKMVKSPRRRK